MYNTKRGRDCAKPNAAAAAVTVAIVNASKVKYVNYKISIILIDRIDSIVFVPSGKCVCARMGAIQFGILKDK